MGRYLIDGDAYAVVVGDDGGEISDRKPGKVWLIPDTPPGRVRFLFNDDQWDEVGHTSSFPLTSPGPSRALEVRMADGDEVLFDLAAPGADYYGVIMVNWSAMFSALP